MVDGAYRQTLYAKLRCDEPLHLGGRHPYGQFRSGDSVLRGGRVLAAFAQANGGGLLFGGGTNIIVEDAPVMVGGLFTDEPVHLPLTAETCKAFEGASWYAADSEYWVQQDREPPHGIWDTLLKRWAVTKKWPGSWAWGWCQECERLTGERGSTKPFVRFVQRRNKGRDERARYAYQAGEPIMERRAHTALNPVRGTAEYGLLFADELVVPDTSFYLRIRLQGRTQQELDDRVQQVRSWEGSTFRLGGAKSRGHGLVKLTSFARDDKAPRPEPIDRRLEQFDSLAKAHGHLEPNRTYFTVTLQAPLILPEQEVYPDWRIGEGATGDWRRIFPGIASLSEVRLEFCQHRYKQVSGWSSLWQLPKPTMHALAEGGVFVFSTTAASSDIVSTAKALEFFGAGCFRVEGFGAISVSDPFHREVGNDA